MQARIHDNSTVNSIVLVRAAPGQAPDSGALATVAGMLEPGRGEVVVFFHGPGSAHAAQPHADAWMRLAERDGRIVLEVCSAAWQRRQDGEPAAPFLRSSLVRFWDRAMSGYQVRSIGGADAA